MLVRKQKKLLAVSGFCIFIFFGIAHAQSETSDAGNSQTGERTGRVAGDLTVTLAISTLSEEELQARRPEMESLIPRKR